MMLRREERSGKCWESSRSHWIVAIGINSDISGIEFASDSSDCF